MLHVESVLVKMSFYWLGSLKLLAKNLRDGMKNCVSYRKKSCSALIEEIKGYKLVQTKNNIYSWI